MIGKNGWFTSNCTFVLPGTGTGVLRIIKIQVSNSRISYITGGGIVSPQWPVSADHTESLKLKLSKKMNEKYSCI